MVPTLLVSSCTRMHAHAAVHTHCRSPCRTPTHQWVGPTVATPGAPRRAAPRGRQGPRAAWPRLHGPPPKTPSPPGWFPAAQGTQEAALFPRPGAFPPAAPRTGLGVTAHVRGDTSPRAPPGAPASPGDSGHQHSQGGGGSRQRGCERAGAHACGVTLRARNRAALHACCPLGHARGRPPRSPRQVLPWRVMACRQIPHAFTFLKLVILKACAGGASRSWGWGGHTGTRQRGRGEHGDPRSLALLQLLSGQGPATARPPPPGHPPCAFPGPQRCRGGCDTPRGSRPYK